MLQIFACIHVETDTALFTLYSKLLSKTYLEAVVLDTEITDSFVHAAYVTKKRSGLLFLKRKFKVKSAKNLCEKAMATSLISFHVLTGCDHSSGFYKVGNKPIVDGVEKISKARNILKRCGTVLLVTQETTNDLQKVVFLYIYRENKNKTLAKA